MVPTLLQRNSIVSVSIVEQRFKVGVLRTVRYCGPTSILAPKNSLVRSALTCDAALGRKRNVHGACGARRASTRRRRMKQIEA